MSVVGSKNPNWFDTHQIPKNAAYAIPDEAATRLMTASLDVTDPTAATRVVSDAVDHFGRIDVLVNSAGYGLITAFEEMSPEQIHQQFATNVYGVMNVTRAVLPVMRRQRLCTETHRSRRCRGSMPAIGVNQRRDPGANLVADSPDLLDRLAFGILEWPIVAL